MELIEGKHTDVSKVICTGGRYSGKSYTVNLGLAHGVAQFGHRILHSRYTLVSASQSIIPDFKDKLDLLGHTEYYTINKSDITSNFDDGRVFFKGIKTGTNFQDSALKSLSDVSIFCTEEASEVPSYDEWEKIHLSVRAMDVQAFSVLILNPADISHWVYKKFFEECGVKAGFNGIVGDTMYIHTTWEDLPIHVITPMHLKRFKKSKEIYLKVESGKLDDPKSIKIHKWYKEVVLGGWRNSVDDVIYDYYELFTEFPDEKPDYHYYGVDWGFENDEFALSEVKVFGERLYCKEHIFQKKLSNAQAIELCKEVIGDEEVYIIADSAEPKSIEEFIKSGLYVFKCKKGPNSVIEGIKIVQSFDMFVHKDSANLIHELDHYHFIEVLNARGEFKIAPVDKWNHLLDSIRYAVTIHGKITEE